MIAGVLRIAAAQYPITRPRDWQDYADKLSRWVAEAAWSGAQLLVFPDGALELAAHLHDVGHVRTATTASQQFLEGFLTLFQELAHRHEVHILAPSLTVVGPGGVRKLSHLVTPGGGVGVHEGLSARASGHGVGVFDTVVGRIGVSLGHDIEFPVIARRQAEAGARLILVPSRAGSMASYHRIRMAAQARALENGCYVVQASTVGAVPGLASLGMSVGAAAVFAPPGPGFPDDGVLAMGALNEPQWLFAELDGKAIERAPGPGRGAVDWGEQARVDVKLIGLR